MIRLEQVCLEYDSDHRILNGIDLEIERGSFHFLAGGSGTGKSTLLSLIALMRRPTDGKLHMFDHETTTMPRESLTELRRKVGMVHQDFRLLNHLTVEENIGLPLRVTGEPQRHIHAKVEEMVEWVGLKETKQSYPPVLSGGQKQRVAIARAVIGNPDIILADEPSGNLDWSLSMRFMHLFTELHKQGTTILYATHDDTLIKKHDYPILRLKKGKITKSHKS